MSGKWLQISVNIFTPHYNLLGLLYLLNCALDPKS